MINHRFHPHVTPCILSFGNVTPHVHLWPPHFGASAAGKKRYCYRATLADRTAYVSPRYISRRLLFKALFPQKRFWHWAAKEMTVTLVMIGVECQNHIINQMLWSMLSLQWQCNPMLFYTARMTMSSWYNLLWAKRCELTPGWFIYLFCFGYHPWISALFHLSHDILIPTRQSLFLLLRTGQSRL